MSLLSDIREGDVFERVGPRPYRNGPEPGDRYEVSRPWTTCTGLLGIDVPAERWSQTAFLSELRDPSRWRLVACGVPPWRGRVDAEWPDCLPPMFARAP